MMVVDFSTPTTTAGEPRLSSSTSSAEESMSSMLGDCDMSFVYYVNNNRKQVKKLVDMDVPLPQTTWFRNPIHRSKDQAMERLSDSIELALKELDEVAQQPQAPSFSLTEAIHGNSVRSLQLQQQQEEEDDDEEQVFHSNYRRQRRRDNRRQLSSRQKKPLPPRASSVPTRIFLKQTSSNTSATADRANRRSSCKSTTNETKQPLAHIKRTRRPPSIVVRHNSSGTPKRHSCTAA
ncbi:expressed unknown protein [Seminavis robusta]|uniref:Uncharacterized protein n=1 Tax=Seminavis robusta TaxID=568900 RepID=A0A9N8DR17_9STRA|nr:expressed unknown protein [Seminavis robusta]|eukprot:Sro220_g090690.1 n/a (235) ;mRNA; r:23795-24499